MPLIEDTLEDATEKLDGEAEDTQDLEEPDAYLYLLDLVASLNNLSEAAVVVKNMLTPEENGVSLPPSVEKVFGLFREKDQFLQTLQISLEKMELFKAAVEGALLSTAALEFTKKAFKEAQS